MNAAKKTLPSRHLFNGFAYTPAHSTDLRTRFAEIRAQQQRPAEVRNVATLLRRNAK